jgi:NAD(P)-dependent dehydrogenase (short-subunit alcohol dehydrogenase family)
MPVLGAGHWKCTRRRAGVRVGTRARGKANQRRARRCPCRTTRAARRGTSLESWGFGPIVAADLGDIESVSSLQDTLRDIDVDILVCNHMYAPTDTPQILDMALDVHNWMIDINARAYVKLIGCRTRTSAVHRGLLREQGLPDCIRRGALVRNAAQRRRRPCGDRRADEHAG